MRYSQISRPDQVPSCRCAVCGGNIFYGDACYETELGPICAEDACIYRYLRETGSTPEEAGELLGLQCKVWAEDRL
ncbi:MAG: hypothetical protein HFF60_04195 [Oscillospiraceae bacterium]|jgi:hypothetical protein|nr:hypothetical protein [Oscillospiraceae bacterium]